jgi:outer membrane lipoprotein carrier protein
VPYNRSSRRFVWTLTLVASLCIAGFGTAQATPDSQPVSAASSGDPAPTAETVAATVQAFYDQTQSVEATFHQTYYSRLYDKYDRSRGQVRFQKPGKMRWDYAAPNNKVIASDGKRLLVYEPGEGDEPGQVFERSLNESQLPQALAFLTGTGKLAEDFRFRLLDGQRQGFAEGQVLELTPRSASPHYERILFYVDSHPKRAGLVHRVLIIDSAGNRNRFDFRDLKFNRSVSPKTFEFEPPSGTRRIEP